MRRHPAFLPHIFYGTLKAINNSQNLFFSVQLQHVLVVALQELGHLFIRLGTSIARSLLHGGDLTATAGHAAADNNSAAVAASTAASGIPRLTDILLSVLLHPCPAPRLAAAW